MLYVGIIIGLIAIIWMKVSSEDGITGSKITLFLLGMMILAKLGGTKVDLFNTVGDFAFVALILFLGYMLFKKLFMR